jgi:hypothetical protein
MTGRVEVYKKYVGLCEDIYMLGQERHTARSNWSSAGDKKQSLPAHALVSIWLIYGDKDLSSSFRYPDSFCRHFANSYACNAKLRNLAMNTSHVPLSKGQNSKQIWCPVHMLSVRCICCFWHMLLQMAHDGITPYVWIDHEVTYLHRGEMQPR